MIFIDFVRSTLRHNGSTLRTLSEVTVTQNLNLNWLTKRSATPPLHWCIRFHWHFLLQSPSSTVSFPIVTIQMKNFWSSSSSVCRISLYWIFHLLQQARWSQLSSRLCRSNRRSGAATFLIVDDFHRMEHQPAVENQPLTWNLSKIWKWKQLIFLGGELAVMLQCLYRKQRGQLACTWAYTQLTLHIYVIWVLNRQNNEAWTLVKTDLEIHFMTVTLLSVKKLNPVTVASNNLQLKIHYDTDLPNVAPFGQAQIKLVWGGTAISSYISRAAAATLCS